MHSCSPRLQMLGSMQLSAVELHGWVTGARCCCSVLPLSVGGVIGCCLTLARGMCALFEICGVVKLVFRAHDWGSPFLSVAHCLLFIGGVGDVAAALLGLVGILARNPLLFLAFVLWGITRFPFWLLFAVFTTTFDTPDIGQAFTFMIAVALVIFDLYLLFVSFEVLLVVTWKGTVSVSTSDTLVLAQRAAIRSGAASCDRCHLVIGLLQDPICLDFLRVGGVDGQVLLQELEEVCGQRYGAGEWMQHTEMLPLGLDATSLIAAAARLQWHAGESKLTPDHLLLALCAKGEVMVMPAHSYLGPNMASGQHAGHCRAVDVVAMRAAHLANRRKLEALTQAVPGAPLFGCLPLEETVAVYLAVQLIVSFMAVCTIIVFGYGLDVLFGLGLKPTTNTYLLECLTGIVDAILATLALVGIHGHRLARWDLRNAALEAGARWDTELDVAYEAASGHVDRERWRRKLKRGADWLLPTVGWSIVQLFVDVPIIITSLTLGDICGAYEHAIPDISHSGWLRYRMPMHCSGFEWMEIACLFTLLMVRLYMCWGLLALWHEYAYGWTTTDLRGAAYLDPFVPLPQAAIRFLAGLPRYAQRRLGGPEAAPLNL